MPFGSVIQSHPNKKCKKYDSISTKSNFTAHIKFDGFLRSKIAKFLKNDKYFYNLTKWCYYCVKWYPLLARLTVMILYNIQREAQNGNGKVLFEGKTIWKFFETPCTFSKQTIKFEHLYAKTCIFAYECPILTKVCKPSLTIFLKIWSIKCGAL